MINIIVGIYEKMKKTPITKKNLSNLLEEIDIIEKLYEGCLIDSAIKAQLFNALTKDFNNVKSVH